MTYFFIYKEVEKMIAFYLKKNFALAFFNILNLIQNLLKIFSTEEVAIITNLSSKIMTAKL